MVTQMGYSDKLGRVRYTGNQEEVFLGHSVTQSKNISEETARIIDKEVHVSLITPGEILIVKKDLLKALPFSKEITGIITDESEEECLNLFKKLKSQISSICNLENLNKNIQDGDLITLQLNEGVVYKGQIEETDETIDKDKYG